MKHQTTNELYGAAVEADKAIAAAHAATRVVVSDLFVQLNAARRELVGLKGSSAGNGVSNPPDVGGGAPELPVSLDDHGVMAAVLAACPTVQDLDKERKWKAGKFHTAPKFLDDWTIRNKDLIRDTLFQGYENFDQQYPDSNIHIRSAGSKGTYGHVDSLLLDQVTIENVCRWGMRLHGIRSGMEITDSLIRNIYEEHGLYLSLCGMGPDAVLDPNDFCVRLSNVAFHRTSSQLLQFVQRDDIWAPKGSSFEGETPNYERDMTPGLPILIDRVTGIDCAGPRGKRESFDFSFFGSRNSVRMRNIFTNDLMQKESRGVFLCQGYEGTGDSFKRSFEIDRFFIQTAASKQELGLFEKMSKTDMRNGVFNIKPGGNASLHFKGDHERVFENVTSIGEPVQVFIDGIHAGTIDELSGVAF